MNYLLLPLGAPSLHDFCNIFFTFSIASGEDWTTESKVDKHSRSNAEESGRLPEVSLEQLKVYSNTESWIILASLVVCRASR